MCNNFYIERRRERRIESILQLIHMCVGGIVHQTIVRIAWNFKAKTSLLDFTIYLFLISQFPLSM